MCPLETLYMQVKQNDETCMENRVVAWSCFLLVGRLKIPDIGYRVSKKKYDTFTFKLTALQQEFGRNISWVYEAYQIREPLIIIKHIYYSPWE